jgi:hypothetical protein
MFLVTSGSKPSQVPSLRQIDSIFIFCMKINKYEHLMNEYSIGVLLGFDIVNLLQE